MGTTNVELAFKQAEQEERKVIATYLYKYLDFKVSVAVDELLKIDLFKNKFSRPTLINYIRSLRRFLRTGERIKLAPPYVYDVAQKLVDKHYAKLTPSENNKFKEKVAKKVVTTPTSLELTETSKQSMSNILNVRNKLELESANAQNSIKKLQDRLSEINGKLKAISVVIDLLK